MLKLRECSPFTHHLQVHFDLIANTYPFTVLFSPSTHLFPFLPIVLIHLPTLIYTINFFLFCCHFHVGCGTIIAQSSFTRQITLSRIIFFSVIFSFTLFNLIPIRIINVTLDMFFRPCSLPRFFSYVQNELHARFVCLLSNQPFFYYCMFHFTKASNVF